MAIEFKLLEKKQLGRLYFGINNNSREDILISFESPLKPPTSFQKLLSRLRLYTIKRNGYFVITPNHSYVMNIQFMHTGDISINKDADLDSVSVQTY